MASNMSDPLAGLIPPPTEVNNAHKVHSVAISCILLCVIASLTVFARLAVRISSERLGFDDYAIIPGTLLFIGWTVLAAYVNLNAGVGKPLWEITIAEYSLWYKGVVVSMWLYPIMSAAIRVSILCFYYRIFVTGNSKLKLPLQILLATQFLYVFVFSVTPAFVCKPYHFAWDPLKHVLYCDDWYYYRTQVGLYSVSMALDAILFALPIVPLWKLKMPTKKRIGLIVIFLLGASSCIAASYKLGIFVNQMKFYVPTNATWLQHMMSRFIPGQWDKYGLTFWIPCQVEPTVALIGTSLPALGNLWTQTSQQISERWSKLTTLSGSKTSKEQNSSGSHKKAWASAGKFGFRGLAGSEVELVQGTNSNSKPTSTVKA
ncbi:hypothetical protein HYFRA_00012419 [Hymenoscyphus fraxineus]|uniref:Rhodopsin domain-containing protein n=1 Tax=Hymenoscyphus fraxineus TaxID=746836 RepID=A0A9N9L9V9_9HELO|nr:hypothetical protein HYFRA_00012419 [Hymenoscyphus fraxineus]